MPESHSEIFFHIVWTTFKRSRLLTAAYRETVYGCIHQQCVKCGVEILAVNGTEDRVHLLIRTGPRIDISDVAKLVKGGSSHLLRRTYGEGEFAWQEGYAAYSLSRWEVPKLLKYIRNQEQHHTIQ